MRGRGAKPRDMGCEAGGEDLGPGHTCPPHLVTSRLKPQLLLVGQRPFASGVLCPLGPRGAHGPGGL